MTPEEACEYLDISMDDDLDLNVLERNYRAKLSRFGDSPVNRRRIDEAYNILCELYAELYANESDKKHEGLFMKMAVLLAGVFLLGFGAIVFFVYRLHSDNIPAKTVNAMDYDKVLRELDELRMLQAQTQSSVSHSDYERVLRELDELRKKQEASSLQNQPAPAAPSQSINNSPADYSELVERVMPSMVFIQTDTSRGSGFFVSQTGDILTNHHVIDNAGFITVTTHDGRKLNASIKDYDTVRDIALLNIGLPGTVPFLRISSMLPRQGEAVIAIGNPRGLSETVSNGIVSAIREVDNNLFVQFTAPVSPGSSGGALVNLHGEVVGMPRLIRTDGQNLNFAIPPTILNQFLNSAINKPAKTLPRRQAAPQRAAVNIGGIPGAKFVRKDDGYEMYLDTEHIDYNRRTGIVSFITYWWPTEKSKAEMRRDSNFTIAPGADLGLCALLYMADFNDNTYVHLRTLNLCTDGSIARNYVRPQDEIKWRTPKNGSRPEALMNAVKRQLRIR